MNRLGVAVLLAVSLTASHAAQQAPSDPDSILLGRIKARISGSLRQLPNYTCVQTIERSRRLAQSRRFQLVDTLRLEVALVNGKELFSWPGAGKFEERELSDIVGGGAAIGNGNFALHARNIFMTNAPEFTPMGEHELEGVRTIRFDYRVPMSRSSYRVRSGDASGIAGYRGSFWVNASTLDLIRLDVHVNEIPSQVPLSRVSDTMEYARVPIGESTFVLPRQSQLHMVDLKGNESLNMTRFSGCRQYTGESTLVFDDPPDLPEDEEETAALPEHIPPRLTVYGRLEVALDTKTVARGDLVTVTIERPVRKDRAVLIPRGAMLRGRVMAVLRIGTSIQSRTGVHIDFYELEVAGQTMPFRARIQAAPPHHTAPDGTIYSRSSNFELRPGLRMALLTLETPPEEPQ